MKVSFTLNAEYLKRRTQFAMRYLIIPKICVLLISIIYLWNWLVMIYEVLFHGQIYVNLLLNILIETPIFIITMKIVSELKHNELPKIIPFLHRIIYYRRTRDILSENMQIEFDLYGYDTYFVNKKHRYKYIHVHKIYITDQAIAFKVFFKWFYIDKISISEVDFNHLIGFVEQMAPKKIIHK